MKGLEVDDLTVTYSGRRDIEAVRGVSFRVAPREIVALLGPSGSGKSSVLGAIAGILPHGGVVSWDGTDLANVPVHRRGFGLVFQDGNLFPHRTVAGNVAFGLEMARVEPGERDARVRDLLALVGLDGFESRRVDELSGGERQRVALARSLAPRPRLLLLDEPLSSLDRDLRDRLAVDTRAVLRATHTTAIVVTHDPDEAATICSRTLRIESGRLVEPRPRARRDGGRSRRFR